MQRYSLKLKSESVVIEDSDGNAKTYTIKELTGKERSLLEGHVSNHLQYAPDGSVSGVKGIGRVNSLLLSLCLYDADGKKLTMEAIDAWPAAVRDSLAEKANIISAMNGEGAKAVKASLMDKEGNG